MPFAHASKTELVRALSAHCASPEAAQAAYGPIATWRLGPNISDLSHLIHASSLLEAKLAR